MMNGWFAVYDGLAGAARLPSLARSRARVSALELLLLLTCGAAAAAAVGFAKRACAFRGTRSCSRPSRWPSACRWRRGVLPVQS